MGGGGPKSKKNLALENFLLGVQYDFLRLAIDVKNNLARGIADHRNLAEPSHAFSKIPVYRDKHREVVVHVALRDFQHQLYGSAAGLLHAVLQLISRHLCAINPFIKEPV